MSMQPPEDNPEHAQPPFTGSPSRPLGQGGSNTNWGRRTGPLSRSLNEPLDLRKYSTTPRYDMTTVADLVGVRAIMLWTWEQNLGLAASDQDPNSGGLRYSERDLIALMWLRDRIVAGTEPAEAAKQIRAAMLTAQDSQGQAPYIAGPASPSVPLRSRGAPSQPISRLGASKPLTDAGAPQPMAPPTGARPPSRPMTGAQAGTAWTGMPSARDLRGLIQPLLNAFSQLDTNAAGRVLDEAFLSQNHTPETVCATLLTPVIARVNELWVRKEEIQPAGLFGLNVIKARLFHFFDSVREHHDAPLTFVAAGPGEPHEVEALMLALFWRRMGLRVVYFGQEINGLSLVNEARRHNPRIVALTLSTTARQRLVAHVAHEISKLDAPRPHLCLIGAALARNAELQRKIGGVYLGADAYEASHHVRQILR